MVTQRAQSLQDLANSLATGAAAKSKNVSKVKINTLDKGESVAVGNDGENIVVAIRPAERGWLKLATTTDKDGKQVRVTQQVDGHPRFKVADGVKSVSLGYVGGKHTIAVNSKPCNARVGCNLTMAIGDYIASFGQGAYMEMVDHATRLPDHSYNQASGASGSVPVVTSIVS